MESSESSAPSSDSKKQPEIDEYNAASVRVSLRLFLASYSGLKLYEVLAQRLLGRAPDP